MTSCLFLSGGIGSTGVLFRLIQLNKLKQFKILHFREKGDCHESTESRFKAVVRLALETRNILGFPLVTEDDSWFCFETVDNLSFESMISKARKTYKCSHFIFGPSINRNDIIPFILENEKIEFPLKNEVESLFSVLQGEILAKNDLFFWMNMNYGRSISEKLFVDCTNYLSSCKKKKVKANLDYKIKREPFFNCCVKHCESCQRYYDAWVKIRHDIPSISIGHLNPKMPGDDRVIENIPNVQYLSRDTENIKKIYSSNLLNSSMKKQIKKHDLYMAKKKKNNEEEEDSNEEDPVDEEEEEEDDEDKEEEVSDDEEDIVEIEEAIESDDDFK